jgi:hypothetical protein
MAAPILATETPLQQVGGCENDQAILHIIVWRMAILALRLIVVDHLNKN